MNEETNSQYNREVKLTFMIFSSTYKGFDVDGAWAEVARSNLTKIDPVTGKVNKRKDGKVLKPEGWTPPDLKPFVKK